MKRLGIRHKLGGLAFALVGVVVIGLTAYFSALHVRAAETALEAKAMTYARLVSREAESAVAFDDKETAREVFEAVALDSDVHAIALYGANGSMLGANGESTVDPVAGAKPELRRAGSVVAVVSPVVSKEGPKGVLVVELSTASIEKEKANSYRAALIAGVAALALGLFASWTIGGSLAKRLGKIQKATQAFAEGELDGPLVADKSNDEIGQLAGDFNEMARQIRALVERIETSSREEKERLDRLVNERTTELRARNGDLKFVLDNVGQGFLTVDADGKLATERSAILATWFGASSADAVLWDYIAASDTTALGWLAMGWSPLFDGSLPPELALDQLPKEIKHGEATFGIRYQPVVEAGSESASKVIVVVSNISDEIARRGAEARQNEMAAVFRQLLSDPSAVEELLGEGAGIVAALAGADERGASTVERKRWLHTLKGNASFIGLMRLATQCHEMESHIVDSGENPSARSVESLLELWEEFRSTFEPVVGTRRDRVDVSRADLAKHIEAILEGRARVDLAHLVQGWTFEQVGQRLDRAAEQARAVAKRLGKDDVEVVIEKSDLKLDGHLWAPFWASFVHVVRNAVDHGIEDLDTRAERGKTGAGRIVLRAYETSTEHVIEVEDDGGGIDWMRLREKAAELGLPVEGETPIELLFADGVSAKAEVSDVSGRGVGLGAARDACVALGGRVEVTSRPGRGTTFCFRVPRTDRTFQAPSRSMQPMSLN